MRRMFGGAITRSESSTIKHVSQALADSVVPLALPQQRPPRYQHRPSRHRSQIQNDFCATLMALNWKQIRPSWGQLYRHWKLELRKGWTSRLSPRRFSASTSNCTKAMTGSMSCSVLTDMKSWCSGKSGWLQSKRNQPRLDPSPCQMFFSTHSVGPI